jgi:repressor LexA
MPIERFVHEEFIEVPASLVRDVTRTYSLKVEGDSMVDDGIFDGDFLLVQQQAFATNGQIVVAMIENEATVKRWHLHPTNNSSPSSEGEFGNPQPTKNLELRPANKNMQSFWYSAQDVEVRGIVVGLIRKMP